MEIVPVRDPASKTRPGLPRGPLFWASVAAFVGAAVGLVGAFASAAMFDSYGSEWGPLAWLFAESTAASGEAFASASLLGVAYLLRGVLRGIGRWLIVAGTAALSLLVFAKVVQIAYTAYMNTGDRWEAYTLPFPVLHQAVFWGSLSLAPVTLLVFAAASFSGREARLGVLLSALCLLAVPFVLLRWWLFPPSDPYSTPSSEAAFVLLGWYPVGVSLLEAPLLILLGIVLLRRARSRALGEAFRAREGENLGAARLLYEEGLGRGDASVVDDLVSEGFRDLKRGSRGKPGMERVFSALRKSYPDLEVFVEEQEAEGDLVRTRLTLSGTDRGGVLWYPPTGRRATFSADFVDRFSDGRLVEHSGEADTQELLRQLGLTESDAAPHPEIQT